MMQMKMVPSGSMPCFSVWWCSADISGEAVGGVEVIVGMWMAI